MRQVGNFVPAQALPVTLRQADVERQSELFHCPLHHAYEGLRPDCAGERREPSFSMAGMQAHAQGKKGAVMRLLHHSCSTNGTLISYGFLDHMGDAFRSTAIAMWGEWGSNILGACRCEEFAAKTPQCIVA